MFEPLRVNADSRGGAYSRRLGVPVHGHVSEFVDSSRRAAVHRSLTVVRELAESDTLDGEDVVPGFACRLADVLV